jgi:hypothetical protein
MFAGHGIAQSPAQPVPVADAPSEAARAQNLRDVRYGVSFRVPPGWNLSRKDGEISSFRLDALSAAPHAQLRAVATIGFNPYPLSTLSGALFYFLVQPHADRTDCEQQATGPVSAIHPQDDIQNIGGTDFTHGHEEHGGICIEARDEIYTAYHKGTCYRFDLELTTFCSVSSGALDLTADQISSVERRMTGILSTVRLDWEKAGPHDVPVPASAPQSAGPGKPQRHVSATQSDR